MRLTPEAMAARAAKCVAGLKAGRSPVEVAADVGCTRWRVYDAAYAAGLDLVALRRARKARDARASGPPIPVGPWARRAAREVCDSAGLARTPERLARAEALVRELTVWAASDRLAAEARA